MTKEVVETKEGMVENLEEREVENALMPVNEVTNLDLINTSDRVMYTTLTDKKRIFNLGTTVDYKINDFENKELNVVDILIKTFRHEEEDFNEETGTIDNNVSFSKVCILIDDNGKSYVTGSKMFTNQMIDYIKMFGINDIKSNGLKIKIVKNKMKDRDTKYLAFELL